MKKIFLAVLLSLCFVLSACDKIQGKTIALSDGHQLPLSALKHKWVFVNYWATWCHNCRGEIAEFNKLMKTPEAKAHVAVLGFNYSELTGEKLTQAIRDFHIDFPVALHNPAGKLPVSHDVAVVPVTFVINPAGKLVKTLWGPQTLASLKQAMRG